MAYATEQDCIDRYGDRSVLVSFDRDGDSTPDQPSLNTVLEQSTAKIDSYLAKVIPQEQLPLNPPSAYITAICVDITLYWGALETGPYTKERRVRYEDACAWLEGVADGSINPGDDLVPAPVLGAGTRISSQPRVFTRSSLGPVL